MKKYLKRPLLDIKKIKSRQNRISELIKFADTRLALSDLMIEIYDIERIISKVSSKKSNPRDLINLKNSLNNTNEIKNNKEVYA